MANRLMEKLGSEYRTLSEQYDEILNRCEEAGRDPDDNEAALLENLRSEMGPLGERLVELRDTDERRFAAVRAMSDAPEVPRSANLPVVQIRSEAEIYHPADAGGERWSFFGDLLHAQVDGELEARNRIERHNLQMRAAGTTTTGAGVVPPTWLFNEFAIIAHGARPWADTLRRVGIENANPVNIGVQATLGAGITAQASENTAPNDGSFNATVMTTSPKTYTGKVDVSRQLVDGSNPAVDGIIYADCMGAYNEQIETAVVAAFDALAAPTGLGVVITYPGTAPVYSNIPDAFIDANASVIKRRKMPARVVFLGIGAWAFLVKQKDTAGRPLVTTGYHGPMNAYGLGEATQYGTIAGEVVGLNCIPSWAGTDNKMYVLKADDCLLLESSTFNFRYEEVLGPQSIRLGVWGYAAPVLGRYPGGIVRIDAGATIPAPQLADGEEEAAASESGEEPQEPGSGPGTPRRRR
jgi:HK97 family phage major capsid protein